MFKIIIILIAFFSLSACVSPMRLGISEAEWRNYSPEERKKIKEGYYEILKNKFHDKEKVSADGSVIQVKVFDGQVNMPPFSHPTNYVPFEFEIPSGSSQTVIIKEQNGNKAVAMHAYYKNKTLFLDPSRYDTEKSLGSIQLHYSPIWDRGFTYQNVSSSGYVHLFHINVAVRRYDKNEQDAREN
jgi:hypothetical protein